MLLPIPDQDSTPFWNYTARGELRIQTCTACRAPRFPPRPCCPHCQSFESVWLISNGRGHLWSYVIPHPPLLPEYAELAPYNVAVIQLSDPPGIRLVGNVVASPEAALDSIPPSRLHIGAALKVAFTTIAPGITVPRWLLEDT